MAAPVVNATTSEGQLSDALFAYGSLMCEEIFLAVSGALACPAQAAILRGFSRHPVHGASYPGIRVAPEGQVQGVLYAGLSPEAMQRLDSFEGSEYRREVHPVHRPDGLQQLAWVYVFEPQLNHRLSLGDWSYEHFLAQHRQDFVRQHMQK